MDELVWFEQLDVIPYQDAVLARGEDNNADEVMRLQRLLDEAGYRCDIDGIFGGGLERTVRTFQKDHGLITDGRIGPKTQWAIEHHEKDPLVLSQDDLERAARELRVDTPAIMAVNTVESRGSGFFDPMHPAILFERHVMFRRLEHYGLPAAIHMSKHPDLVNTKTGGYIGGIAEHQRLSRAEKLDEVSALESASWGAFQIMGYHWKRLGYRDVYHFVNQMAKSEAHQLEAFVLFIKADSKLWQALREHRWADFAYRYNGKGYRKNAYDTKMADAHRRYTNYAFT